MMGGVTRINPYAPPGRQVSTEYIPPTPALPDARLRRLGVTDRSLEVLGLWWDRFPPEDRRAIAEALSEMTDTEMAEWMRHADVPTGTVDEVMAWVGRHEDRALAAFMALLAEESAAKPRATLVAALRSLVG